MPISVFCSEGSVFRKLEVDSMPCSELSKGTATRRNPFMISTNCWNLCERNRGKERSEFCFPHSQFFSPIPSVHRGIFFDLGSSCQGNRTRVLIVGAASLWRKFSKKMRLFLKVILKCNSNSLTHVFQYFVVFPDRDRCQSTRPTRSSVFAFPDGVRRRENLG